MAFLGVLQRPESLSAQLGRGLGSGIGQGASDFAQRIVGKRREKEENEALQRLTGQDFTGMSPEIKKEFVKLYTGARSQKEQEKHQMLETGLGTIQEMRNLIKSTGPSNWFQSLIPGDTQRERQEFAQLGKSLIPLVSAGVSIRNQKEFDEYKKVLTDPNAQQSKIEGALNGLENLLQRQTQQKEKENAKEEHEVKQSKSSSSEMVKMRSPEGKIVSVPKKDVKSAMNAGGKVIK